MANKQNNIFKYLFVPLLVAVCLAALSLWLYFGYFNDDGSSKRPFAPPSILISSASHSATFGERGYIGASLVYDDGTVEDGVFSYSSDDPLLTFPDSSSGYFVVGSSDSVSPDFNLGDSVTVTVSCTDIENVELAELKIAIYGEETTVRFEYYSDFSGELKSEAVSASDGSPTGLPEGFAEDALVGLGRRVRPRALSVLYRAQAHLGDVVTPVAHERADGWDVDLTDGEGATYALVRFDARQEEA